MNIYVEQYGLLWRLTPGRWAYAVECALKGVAFDWDELGHQMERIPYFCYRAEDGRLGIATNRHRLFKPLDWDDQDWRDAQAELAELGA